MDFGLIERYVGAGCDLDTDNHTDEGEDRCCQSNREDGDNAKFCLSAHLQAPDRLDGQEEDDDVGDDIEDAATDHERGKVHAMPFQSFVPHLFAWYTFPNLDDHTGELETSDHEYEDLS